MAHVFSWLLALFVQVRIRVLRNGDNAFVPVKDIVVGDIVHLETGDKIVADGVFISGAFVYH